LIEKDLRLETVVSSLFDENCYLLARHGSPDCLVIDPGLEPDKIIARLEAMKLQPAAVLLTHGHADHIGGNTAIKQRWPQCPILIGADDAPKLTDPRQNLSADFGLPLVSPPADRTLVDGQRLELAGLALQVRAIAGHSRGQVVYLLEDHQPPIVFAGDVIFAGSIGRTDTGRPPPWGKSGAAIRSWAKAAGSHSGRWLFALPINTYTSGQMRKKPGVRAPVQSASISFRRSKRMPQPGRWGNTTRPRSSRTPTAASSASSTAPSRSA